MLTDLISGEAVDSLYSSCDGGPLILARGRPRFGRRASARPPPLSVRVLVYVCVCVCVCVIRGVCVCVRA